MAMIPTGDCDMGGIVAAKNGRPTSKTHENHSVPRKRVLLFQALE